MEGPCGCGLEGGTQWKSGWHIRRDEKKHLHLEKPGAEKLMVGDLAEGEGQCRISIREV